MEQAEKLAALLQKLKANKEKVPLEVLKTKYKAAYEQLCQDIKDEAQKYLKQVIVKSPDFLEGTKIKNKYMDELVDIYNQLYESGDYAKKIGHALFKNYSIPEAEALAKEVSAVFREEALKYFHSKTCLYATAECFDLKDTKTPKIYNDLIDKFWDEETGTWREPRDDERQNALLIFVGDKKEEKKDE